MTQNNKNTVKESWSVPGLLFKLNPEKSQIDSQCVGALCATYEIIETPEAGAEFPGLEAKSWQI